MTRGLLLTALLLSSLTRLHAEEQPAPTQFKEDFSDEAAVWRNWEQHGPPLPPSHDKTKPFWQVTDGTLHGFAYPGVHPIGIFHKISGKDVRLSMRFKTQQGSWPAICFNGPNPILEMDNFHLAGFHIFADKIVAWDETNLHPKGSPEAAELKKKGEPNRKFIYAKSEKITLAPDVWHDLVVELRGRDITGIIDGKEVITYKTNAGDAPKKSVQLSIGGTKDAKEVSGWIDDVSVEPLTEKK